MHRLPFGTIVAIIVAMFIGGVIGNVGVIIIIIITTAIIVIIIATTIVAITTVNVTSFTRVGQITRHKLCLLDVCAIWWVPANNC